MSFNGNIGPAFANPVEWKYVCRCEKKFCFMCERQMWCRGACKKYFHNVYAKEDMICIDCLYGVVKYEQ
jgi:hypothetical protein